MKIRLVLISFIFSFSHIGCSQDIMIIFKKCFNESTESFPSKNYKCQKLYFENENLVYIINYSLNNWQIIDSIVYQYGKGEYCIKSYQPIYNIENSTIDSYELLNVDCNQNILSVNSLNDRYSLSKFYIRSVEFLLSKHPEKYNDEYKFKDGIIPSLFMQYGIPYNESLNSFSFKIDAGMLRNDKYVFKNFVLTRNFEYENGILKKVRILIKDVNENVISDMIEMFELEI